MNKQQADRAEAIERNRQFQIDFYLMAVKAAPVSDEPVPANDDCCSDRSY